LPQIKCWFNLGNGGCVRRNTGPEISAFLRDGSSDGRALHFSLVVDNNTGVIFEVQEGTVSSSESLGLSDNDGGVDLLSEFWLSFLHGGHDEISRSGGWESVQSTFDAGNGDDVERLGASVISAVHNGSNWEGEGDMELSTSFTTASTL